KTKRRRDVPLVGLALETLKEMSAQPHSPDNYIFPATNRNAPFRSYRKAWEFAVKRAGLSHDVVYHSLRHTTASYLVQAGTPLYTVGAILGHVSPTTTAIYSHLATDNLKGALEVLAQRVEG